MEEQICSVSFPGLAGIMSANYTCPDGIRPGQGSFSVAIDPDRPPQLPRYGPVIFSDGHRTYVVPNCRVDSVSSDISPGGVTWRIEFSDRRWQWEHALIEGAYNLQDSRGNLLPGTIKTPKELVKLCLEALGETGYSIDMPEGVKEQGGPIDENPAPGTGIKSIKSELNPLINWDNMPAAEAMARLCDTFNRRIVYDPLTNKVRILKAHVGGALPNDHIETASGNLSFPPQASGYGVIGAPIRFQGRFLLEAVGREWDDRLVPIDELSYAPDRNPQPSSYSIVMGAFDAASVYRVVVNGVTFTATGLADEATTLQSLASQINDSVFTSFSASYSAGAGLTVTGVGQFPLTVEASGTPPGALAAVLISRVVPSRWDLSAAPEFPGVRATDRLSWREAQSRAKSSVFRMYRVSMLDPRFGHYDPQDMLYILGVGYVGRKYRIQLFPTKVEQVTPDERDPNRVLNASKEFLADIPNYYNGYSRDRLAEVFGSAHQSNGPIFQKDAVDGVEQATDPVTGLSVPKKYLNTKFENRIEASFSVDAGNLCVVFQEPVYEYSWAAGNRYTIPARLILETSFYLRDTETNQVLRYRRWAKLADTKKDDKSTGSRGPIRALTRKDNDVTVTKWDHDPHIQWFNHDDVIRTRISRYAVNNEARRQLQTRVEFGEDDNATKCADFYLDQHLSRIQTEGGEQRTYAGVALVPLDGAIRMVRLSFNAGGITTTASRNYEADRYLSSYPIRRFREALEPTAATQEQNREMYRIAQNANNMALRDAQSREQGIK